MTLNSERILIRAYKFDDQKCVKELILEGLKERFGQIDNTLNPDLNDIEQYYLNNGHMFFVYTHGDRIIGSGALLIDRLNKEAQIVRVSVDVAYRRAGLADKMVKFLVKQATLAGCKKVVVETCKDWQSAIMLYRKNGFIAYHEDDIDIYLSRVIKN